MTTARTPLAPFDLVAAIARAAESIGARFTPGAVAPATLTAVSLVPLRTRQPASLPGEPERRIDESGDQTMAAGQALAQLRPRWPWPWRSLAGLAAAAGLVGTVMAASSGASGERQELRGSGPAGTEGALDLDDDAASSEPGAEPAEAAAPGQARADASGSRCVDLTTCPCQPVHRQKCRHNHGCLWHARTYTGFH